MKKRRIANADLELVQPKSFAERLDVLALLSDGAANHRVAAAALGLCWPRLRRKVKYGGRVLEFAGQVIDLLSEEGATFDEIMEAGAEALELIASAHFPSGDGVKAKVGNSSDPAE